MAGMYEIINNVARKTKYPYTIVSGVARKTKNGFIEIGGVARKFFSGFEYAEYLSLPYGAKPSDVRLNTVVKSDSGITITLDTGTSGYVGWGIEIPGTYYKNVIQVGYTGLSGTSTQENHTSGYLDVYIAPSVRASAFRQGQTSGTITLDLSNNSSTYDSLMIYLINCDYDWTQVTITSIKINGEELL